MSTKKLVLIIISILLLGVIAVGFIVFYTLKNPPSISTENIQVPVAATSTNK